MKSLKILIFLGVGIGLFYLVLRNVPVGEMVGIIKEADFFWVFIAILIGVVSHYFRAVRWKLLLNPLNYTVSDKNSFYAVMVGYLANIFIPRAGEVSRCALVAKSDKIPLNVLIGTVVVERIVDMVFLVLIIGLTFISQIALLGDFFAEKVYAPLQDKLISLAGGMQNLVISSLVIGLVLGALFLVFRKRIVHSVVFAKSVEIFRGFLKGFQSIMKLEKPGLFILQSLLIWTGYYLSTYVCFFAFGFTSHLNLLAGLTVLAMSSLGVVAPVSGGIGAVHFMVTQGLLLYGIDEVRGFAFATLLHASQMILILSVGGICLFLSMMSQNKQSKHPLPEDINIETNPLKIKSN